MKKNDVNNIEKSNKQTIFDLPEGIPPLNTFYLYMTTGCNLFCQHCWITPSFVKGEPSPGEFIDLEDLKSAV
ncbi:MAG: hypothetical protein KAR14_15320, partial [Candidatus Aminicenantes bacterium]|nr:hypothetical protein [Candidatus Aminicenantes bacterium]